MNMQWNTMALSYRSRDSHGWKTLYAALLAVWVLVPYTHTQADPPPESSVLAFRHEKGGLIYTMTFQSGSINDLKRLWMENFKEDNFLINFSGNPNPVVLPAFQIGHVTLSELARSIAFLSNGALTVEVVEKSASLPVNIWRVTQVSPKALAESVRIRAVAAPHIFTNAATLGRFLEDAEQVQRRIIELSRDLQRVDNAAPVIGVSMMQLPEQRVFVLTGTEAGVSGMESFIKAAEQAAAERSKKF